MRWPPPWKKIWQFKLPVNIHKRCKKLFAVPGARFKGSIVKTRRKKGKNGKSDEVRLWLVLFSEAGQKREKAGGKARWQEGLAGAVETESPESPVNVLHFTALFCDEK